MNLLSARNVSHAYRRFSLAGASPSAHVLHGINLDIGEGETVALLGRSGRGKSTLARLLVGLETPQAGEILFQNRALAGFRSRDWHDLRRSVQMVFQDPMGAVNPRLTVAGIVSEPLRQLCDLPKARWASRVEELLLAVGLRADDADKLPQQMSGGQLQRVCIARALATEPKLIILDEAVSNLDLHLQIRMLDLFSKLQCERGVSYLFVTHDLRLVERFCSRLIVMERGRIVEETPVARPLKLVSQEGRRLHDAVLPAMPAGGRIETPRVRLRA